MIENQKETLGFALLSSTGKCFGFRGPSSRGHFPARVPGQTPGKGRMGIRGTAQLLEYALPGVSPRLRFQLVDIGALQLPRLVFHCLSQSQVVQHLT